MLSSLALVGRLTKDPHVIKDGMVKFSIAVNHTKTEATFFDCIAYEKLANIIGQYAKKGRVVAVSGDFKNSPYVDKNGEKRDCLQLTARTFQFVDVRDGDGEDNRPVPQEDRDPATPPPKGTFKY